MFNIVVRVLPQMVSVARGVRNAYVANLRNHSPLSDSVWSELLPKICSEQKFDY